MSRLKGLKIKGFTLIELIIVIVIVSILSGLSAQFLKLGFTAYFFGQNLIDADSQARAALSRITDDLHNLRSNADITTASATTLQFTDLSGNLLTYQVTNSQLLRSNLLLAKDAQSITFQYYDLAGTALAPPVTGANIALIRYVTLTLSISNFPYTTGVTLWNTL